MMSWLGLAYGRAGRPRHTSSLNPGRASDAGPVLTQPSPLADVEDERIVKRGTRVMRCANPRPTPIGSSTRCATAAFRGRPYRFPNSPRQVVVPASDVLGCPVHRVQALELGPDELVAVGAVALRAPGAAQRERRCRPLTYANLPLPRILFRINAIPLADRAVPVVDLSRRVGRLNRRERLEDLVRVPGVPGNDPRVARLQKDHLSLAVQLGASRDHIAHRLVIPCDLRHRRT